MVYAFGLLFGFLFLAFAPKALGAEESSSAIEDITVTAPTSAQAASAESFSALPESRVARSDARSVADVLRRAPGALVQTNSRGETLVFLRNAGERQVSVFFDGASLEVPWDHRLDLKLIPASAIGKTEVARGPLSNRYGPNVSGGAVFFGPRVAAAYQAAQLKAEVGGQGYRSLQSSISLTPIESLSFVVSGEHTGYDGESLAEALPFSQASDELRTNTDAERTSALAHAAAHFAGVDLTATALYGRAALGVAPESHLDPSVDRVRFWRYPNSELAMVIAGAKASNEFGALDAVVWWHAFDQTIESYASAAYDERLERQRDTNRTLGARVRLVGAFGPHRLSVGAYGNVSAHEERRTASDRDPLVDAFLTGLWSSGVDYELAWDGLRLRAGGGVDGFEPFDTAGRPSAGAFRTWNVSAGARQELGPGWSVHFAVGSRARLPTARELYGTALDRFLLNPDLSPERNTTLEVGAKLSGRLGTLEVTPFATWTDDTLAQQNVPTDDGTFRQRINLKGSRVLGIEAIGNVQLMPWARLGGQALLSDVRRFGGGEDRLAERPGIQGFVDFVLGYEDGFELTNELFVRGPAFSLGPKSLQEVSGAVLFNLRASYRLVSAWGQLEVYVRADNMFDARLVPQLGLPEPGRQIRSGLNVAF